MHYFHNLSSASGGFAPRPTPGLHPWTPLKDFLPQTPNLDTPQKNPAGAHKSKGKAEHLYSALHGIQTTLKRSGMDHAVYLQ